MLMPETTANIWLMTKPTATSDLDGGNHLTRRKTKARTKAKTQLRKNSLGASTASPAPTGFPCAESPKKAEKQKQFIA
jgi:hypothetical protein